jgi:hypothetical protein
MVPPSQKGIPVRGYACGRAQIVNFTTKSKRGAKNPVSKICVINGSL